MITQLETALVKILSSSMSDILPGAEQVGVCLPDNPGQLSLGLYLYNIRPCAEVSLPSIISKGRNIQSLPPRFLSLYYLITAYSKADAAFRAQEDHRILLRAMQVLEEIPVLREGNLGFAPGQYISELKIQLIDLAPEDMSHIWQFRDASFRLSVAYRVFPVELTKLNGNIIKRVADTNFSGKQV